MVRFWQLLLFFPLALFAQDVRVTAEIDAAKAVEESPLIGSITVTHDKGELVDLKSFRLEREPLAVEFVKEVALEPQGGLVISIFRFSLLSQSAGLHILPEISVTVGGKRFRSIASTYNVGRRPRIQVKKKEVAEQPSLELKPIIIGKLPLYPGQRLNVGYQMFYNQSLELTKEELPLLKPPGFRHIGGKQISEAKNGDVQIFEVVQTIEAVKPGDYPIGKAVVEGLAYRTVEGKKLYAKAPLRAEVAPLTLTVLPLPEKGRPLSFNGAVGQLDFSVERVDSGSVVVGDQIRLRATVTGEGLETVSFPDLSCQPGFSGLFQLGDWPAVPKWDGEQIDFLFELRPLSSAIEVVPPITFSYFDPEKGDYQQVKSAPLPLTVAPRTRLDKRAFGVAKPVDVVEVVVAASVPLAPSYSLRIEKLTPNFFGWYWTWLFPLVAGALLLYQLRVRESRGRRVVKSDALFRQAMAVGGSAAEFADLFERAFLLRLKEIGALLDLPISFAQLSKEGRAGEVRRLLEELARRRFSPGAPAIDRQFLSKSRQLFDSLKEDR